MAACIWQEALDRMRVCLRLSGCASVSVWACLFRCLLLS